MTGTSQGSDQTHEGTNSTSTASSHSGAESGSSDVSLNELSANHNNDVFASTVVGACVDALSNQVDLASSHDLITEQVGNTTHNKNNSNAFRRNEEKAHLLASTEDNMDEYTQSVDDSANLWNKAMTTLAKSKCSKTKNDSDKPEGPNENLPAYDMNVVLLDGSINGGVANPESPEQKSPSKKHHQMIQPSDYSIDGESAILWSDDVEQNYFRYMMDQEKQHRAELGKDQDDSLLGGSTRDELLNAVATGHQAGIGGTSTFDEDSTLGHGSKIFGWDPTVVGASATGGSTLTNSLLRGTITRDKDGHLIIPNVIYVNDGNNSNSTPEPNVITRKWNTPSTKESGSPPSSQKKKNGKQPTKRPPKKHLDQDDETHTAMPPKSPCHTNRILIGAAIFFLLLTTGLVAALIVYRNHYSQNGNSSTSTASSNLGDNGNVMPAPAPSTPYPTVSIGKKPDDDEFYFGGDNTDEEEEIEETDSPTAEPTEAPSMVPSAGPTEEPTAAPSLAPSLAPSMVPSIVPSMEPSVSPTSAEPSTAPSNSTTPEIDAESSIPSDPISAEPSVAETQGPSASPTGAPVTESPTVQATVAPTGAPSIATTELPTTSPTKAPITAEPTGVPTTASPTMPPTRATSNPTAAPSNLPPVPSYVAFDTVRNFLLEFSPDSTEDLFNEESKQFSALRWLQQWMASISPEYLGSHTKRRIVQRWALAVAYFSLDGPNWAKRNLWLGDTDVCEWIEANNQGSCVDDAIVSLDLSNNALSGTLPKELSLLSNSLTRLEFDRNEIRGPLPSQYGRLSQLVSLDFTRCDLTGTIPTQLGRLDDLAILGLGRNDFVGKIPTQLGNLQNLVYLGLERNDLSGTIPIELTGLWNLEYLALDWNELTGRVPTEMALLERLRTLILARNNLEGQVPDDFCERQMDFLAADCNDVLCPCCDLCCENGRGCASTRV